MNFRSESSTCCKGPARALERVNMATVIISIKYLSIVFNFVVKNVVDVHMERGRCDISSLLTWPIVYTKD